MHKLLKRTLRAFALLPALLFGGPAHADSTVTAMTAAAALTGAELLYCVQSAADRKCTVTQVQTFITTTPVSMSGGTISGSGTGSFLSIAGTWNTTGVVDAGLLLNVTNTASGAGSLLMDLQIAGASQLSVNLAGLVTLPGAVATSGLKFTGSGTPLIYDPSGTSGAIVVNVGGTDMFAVTSSSQALLNSAASFAWASGSPVTNSADTILLRDAAGIISQANAANAQTFRVYNTSGGGSNPTNYERGVMDWTTTANVLTVGTQAGGTGSTRNLKFVVGGTNQLDYGITAIGVWNAGSSIRITGGGSAANPGIQFFDTRGIFAGGAGIYIGAGGNTYMGQQGNSGFNWQQAANGTLTWSNTSSDPTQSADSGLARSAAGVIEVDNGTAGTLREITARSYMSGGSVPVDGGGSCTATSFVGGGTVGTFTAPTCAAGTIAVTFAFTATNGWSCDAEDRTTPTTGLLQQTATTTTKATFKATTTASDVIQYKCIAY